MKTDSKLAIEATIKQTYPGMVTEMDVDWEIIEIAFQAGVKEGGQEVVDWIERYSESDGDNPLEFSIFPEKYWQVQRKEWEKEC